MTFIRQALVLTFLSACAAGVEAQEAQPLAQGAPVSTGELRIVVRGLESDEGAVMIALFDSEDTFATENVVRAEVLPIDDGACEWVAGDLPHGDYAVAVYHDKDGDGELDSNFLGMPTEKYGFSNDARGRFGPPSYEDARIVLDGPTLALEIQVK